MVSSNSDCAMAIVYVCEVRTCCTWSTEKYNNKLLRSLKPPAKSLQLENKYDDDTNTILFKAKDK